MFKLEIKTGGAAYRDEDSNELDSTNHELIRNLKEVIHHLENGCNSRSIIDINGNKVGSWNLED